MPALAFALRNLLRDLKSGELAVLVLALVVAVASLTAVGFFTSRIGLAVERQHHVLERRERRHEVERLEDETDVAGPHGRTAVLVEPGEIVARQQRAARRRFVEAGEQGKQRRFPGP